MITRWERSQGSLKKTHSTDPLMSSMVTKAFLSPRFVRICRKVLTMPAMRTSMMSADPEVRRKMINAVPMGREGCVEEVAHANLFLASDDASYITGIEVPVDGGFVAQ